MTCQVKMTFIPIPRAENNRNNRTNTFDHSYIPSMLQVCAVQHIFDTFLSFQPLGMPQDDPGVALPKTWYEPEEDRPAKV